MTNQCMRIKGVVISRDFKPGYITVARLNCKMWSCPHCAEVNAKAWRAYLLDRFNKSQNLAHEKWCFMTITAHKNAHKAGAQQTILNLQQVWKKLYDRLLRRYGRKNIQYVRVFERHASGRYHMHILINCGSAYDAHNFVIRSEMDEFRHPECKWLRASCAAIGGGWRVHVRRVWDDVKKTANVGLVVGYVLKYMNKQLSLPEFPKHQRRILTSQGIGSPNTAGGTRGTWEVKREISIDFVLANHGKVYDISTGEVLSLNSFENEHYYPPLRYYKG